jgi:neutral trehalase
MIGNRKYNKYSGPTNKYSYIKSIIEYNKSTRSKYSLVSTEDAKRCIGDKPIEILNILKNNDVNCLSGYISRDKGLSINLYNTAEFTFDQCNADNGKFIEEIARIYADLNNQYVPNMSKALQFFNNYALCDISVIQGMYPGSIFVELFINDSTYMCFTFINEENDWKLVQIINNVADFD